MTSQTSLVALPASRVSPMPARATVCCLAVLGLFSVMLLHPAVLNDPDTYWHLATGEWILSHHAIPKTDPFSFTHLGQPWVAHEWLSEALMGLAYRACGWSGVVLMFALAMAAAMTIFTRSLARWLNPIPLAATVVLSASCAAPGFLDRPHLLALPALLFWTDTLLRARERGVAPPLWLALLMTLWANLHGSFVLGFLVAGALGLEALMEAEDRLSVLRTWGAFAALSLLATLATPHGVEAYMYPFHVMTMRTLGAIGEWRAADFSSLSGLEIGLVTVLTMSLTRNVRASLPRSVLLVFLLHMALQHYRHQFVLGFLAPMLLAKPIGEGLGVIPGETNHSWRASACLVLGVLLISTILLLKPVVRRDSVNTPATALAHVPADLASQPVLNSHPFGGFLIWKGVRPFIDGRTDMYGDALFAQHIAAMSGDLNAFDAIVKRYDIRWTILSPSDELARRMDAQPEWKLLYRDQWATIHVRKDDRAPSSPSLTSLRAARSGGG